MSKLAELSFKAYGEELPLKIAGILCYETGDVLRDLVRIEDYPDIAYIYVKQAKVSLGDVLAMAHLLCEMLEWDFATIEKEGLERACERCEEKLKGMDGF